MDPEQDNARLRAFWRNQGGEFHGSNVETGTMPEDRLLPMLRSLLAPPGQASHVGLASEMTALAIKAGCRASYDLLHAVDEIKDPEIQKSFRARAHMWLEIFQLDSGLKDYRHRLHQDISRLEARCTRLAALCRENDIDMGEDEIWT